jgi:hypothetical protein
MAADYRSVQTSMWRADEWFQLLDTDARLFWIYLFTNPSASVAGIYKLPLRTMAFETGLDVQRVADLLTQFAQDGKAYYEAGVVWVRKMREYQLPGKVSPQLAAHIEGELARIPDGHLKRRYQMTYGYPIDTVSILNLTETETDTDTETVQQPAAPSPAPAPPQPQPAAKPKRTTKPRDENLDHPAVVAYRDVCRLTPNLVQREQIVAKVTNVDKWRTTLTWWMSKGYRPQNVDGMLDHYSTGGTNGNGRTQTHQRGGIQSLTTDADRAYHASQPDDDELARLRAAWDAGMPAL